jgi:uncharacterized protein (DUF1800 family)
MFAPDMHESGDKVVLGKQIPIGDISEGEAVLRILVEHPSTARFIATKLVRRFVADDPPQSLVDKVAKVFADTQGDVREMVKTILTSDEFYAPEAIGSKIKSPFELMVSGARVLEVEVQVPGDLQVRTVSFGNTGAAASMVITKRPSDVPQETLITLIGQRRGLALEVQAYCSLVQIMEEMGQFLYQHEAPDGYPETGGHWLNEVTVLLRLNFGLSLVSNSLSGLVVDEQKLAARVPGGTDSGESWKATLAVLTGKAEPPQPQETPAFDTLHNVILSLGSPDFQRK